MALAAAVVYMATRKPIRGKKALQKLLCFCTEIGLPLRLSFKMHADGGLYAGAPALKAPGGEACVPKRRRRCGGDGGDRLCATVLLCGDHGFFPQGSN